MKSIIMALILWGAFSWSHAMAQTQEQGHKHEQHQEEKDAPAKNGHDYEGRDETENEGKDAGYEMLCKGGAERTEKLNTVHFTQSFLAMTPIGLNHFP